MTGALCGTSYSGKQFEAHLTVEPVEGERLELFIEIAKMYKFRVADLVMVKDRRVTEERSNRDSFCTGWGDDVDSIMTDVLNLKAALVINGFKVWRWKIEETIEDWRVER